MNMLLSDLRASVVTNDWDRSGTIFMSIICFIDYNSRKYLFNKFMNIYLSDFFYFPYQEHLPDISVENIEKLRLKLEPLLGQPGMSNFISSLKKYDYIYNSYNCTDEFSEIYTSAISSLIISILIHQWGSQKIDLWEKWRKGTSTDDFLILARYFRTDEEVLQRARKLWDYIIDVFSSESNGNSADTS